MRNVPVEVPTTSLSPNHHRQSRLFILVLSTICKDDINAFLGNLNNGAWPKGTVHHSIYHTHKLRGANFIE
jgi:hypothetical protein